MNIDLTDSFYLDEIINDKNNIWWEDFKKDVQRNKQLLDRFLMYKVCDNDEEFKLSQEDLETLCVQLNNISRTLKAQLDIAIKERNEYKKSWSPDWEICYGCNKRYTSRCNPDECNPMDI